MLDRSGALATTMFLRGIAPISTVTVVTFHRIGEPDREDPFDAGVVDATPAQFRRRIEALSRVGTPIGLDALIAALDGARLPGNPFLITFDDGYRSCREIALPILRELGVPAMFFVATGFAGGTRLYWWEQIAVYLNRAGSRIAELSYPHRIRIDTRDPTLQRALVDIVKNVAGLDLARFLAELRAALDLEWNDQIERAFANRLIMSWDDIRALRAAGMDVESHTRWHRVLETLDDDALRDELVGSRQDLDRELGYRGRAIAYPVGRRPSARVRKAAADAGYQIAFSNCGGVNSLWPRWLHAVDRFDLSRIATECSQSDALLLAQIAIPRLAYPVAANGSPDDGQTHQLRTRGGAPRAGGGMALAASSSMQSSGVVVELSRLRRSPDWQRWQSLTANAPPFLTPEFFTLASRMVDAEAIVAEAWDNQDLVGALPLVRTGDHLRNLRCDYTPEYDYWGTASGIETIWRALRCDPRWNDLELAKIPAGSPLATRLPALATADGYPIAVRTDSCHPYFPLANFEAELSPKFRTNLARCARKAGGVELERLAIPDRAAFDEALAIEAMAWKGAAGTSLDGDARAAHLYRALSRLVGRRGMGALYFLRAGGRRIATMFAVEDGKTLYALKIGYDPTAANLSPGHLLVWKIAADAAARGLAELNFVGREDDWKRKWTTRVHDHIALVIYRPNSIGLGRFAMRQIIRPRLPANLRGGFRDVLPRHCQRADLIGTHSVVERVHDRVRSGLGIRSGIKRLVGRAPVPRDRLGAPSAFAAGSWVRVKPAAELRATLDDRDRTRGLAFVATQWETADQVYRVDRHVRRLRDDHGKFRAVSRTVLLEGCDCAGRGSEPAGCGRHCPMMYRDEWLEPAEPPPRGPTPPAPSTPTIQYARVRDLGEIRDGLDPWGRRDGLTFMPAMAEHVGKRFAIANRISRVFECDHWVATRAPVFVLAGLHCGGEVTGKNGPCDRACSLLWHADWLVIEPLPTGHE